MPWLRVPAMRWVRHKATLSDPPTYKLSLSKAERETLMRARAFAVEARMKLQDEVGEYNTEKSGAGADLQALDALLISALSGLEYEVRGF